ncbi:hypothetical protein MNBD_ACTINO02-1667 [hydrothermal vent metagenome]|uniref:DUF4097 domain-containing protein n=1 Tax=hydrothermal vent metagenome TaxID=652676 RepID=A0A3B0T142_9ZZZZ
MSRERNEVFAVGGTPQVDIGVSSEDVLILHGSTSEIGVRIEGSGADDFALTQAGDTVLITAPRGRRLLSGSGRLTVTVPKKTAVDIRTASGDVHIKAGVTRLDVATASGDIRAGDVHGDVRVRSASGDCLFGNIDGSFDVATASGDIRAGTVRGSVSIASASGDVRLAAVEGLATFKTASGDLAVDMFDGPTFDMKTMSGDATLGIPRRRRLELDLQLLAGGLRNRLPESDGSKPEKTIAIRAIGMSGDLTLRGA